MKLIFATNNLNKLKEIKQLLKDNYTVIGLEQTACNEDIPENQDTIEGNASEKALYFYNNYKYNCFADDTGLEIDALNGAPGVYSARYAGEQKNSNDNMKKVLKELDGQENRKARFKTVISLIIDGKEKLFEGIVDGTIGTKLMGTDGFGYDPIFIPTGYTKTFAELSSNVKNKISHRGIAIRKLTDYLNNL